MYVDLSVTTTSITSGFSKESYDVSDIMIDIYKHLKFVLSKSLL